PKDALGTVGVGRHFAAEAVSVSHDGLHFFQRVLRGLRVIAHGKHASGGADLNQVGAIFDDLAHLVLHGFHAVGYAIVLAVVVVGQQVVVAVAAGDAEGRTADQHAGAGHVAGVDGVTQGYVGVARGPHVAHGGETRFQRDAGIAGAHERRTGHRNAQRRVAEVVGIHGEVGVRVNQAGHDGEVRQLDADRTRWHAGLGGRADADNALVFDEDDLVGKGTPAAHVQQA